MRYVPWVQIVMFILSIAVVVILIAVFNWPSWLIALPVFWGPSIGVTIRNRRMRTEQTNDPRPAGNEN